jgi:hypothetical protein
MLISIYTLVRELQGGRFVIIFFLMEKDNK